MNGTQLSGIDPGLTKEKEIKDEILDKAIANAREQAEKTLKAMGAKIDSVFAVSPRVIVTGFYIPTGGDFPYPPGRNASTFFS